MTDARHPTRIPLEEALEIVRIRSTEHRLPAEPVRLDTVRGRVLAEDIHAPHDLPPFANSAMDGFALCGAELPNDGEQGFELIGDVFAGAPSAPRIASGQCARITTGAPLPPGADTVVIKENVRVEDERVFVRAGEKAGSNVRAAGEDFAAGDLALKSGVRLHPSQLGVLAALGMDQVQVRRKPRVAVIVTGDELVPAGQPLGFGQIHESNGVLISALLHEAGAEVVSRVCVRDNPDALRAALLDAASDADLIVSSGGVSAGEADHLPALLQELGEIHFHKVRIKPGMPILFGAIGASLYFGLPGNPVSAAVTFQVFVRFALRAMLGESGIPQVRHARLAEPVHKKHARAELMRCALTCDPEGVLWAAPHAKQGSGMLRGLVESNALVLLPEDAHELERSAVVAVWPQD
ncbi:MAG: molybdopterin molybdotransferase MoeA [Rhodanobacteraceae bacterium]